MSYLDFKNAMKLAPKCKFYTIVGGKTDKEIERAEDILGVHFSRQSIEFYKEFGYLSFFGTEIFGIDPDDESGFLEGNSVAYAIKDRKEYKLPKNWIPIYNFQDGNMAYLDYSTLNEENEPKVILAYYDGEKYEVIEDLAEDFGDFLMQLVQEQIESQDD